MNSEDMEGWILERMIWQVLGEQMDVKNKPWDNFCLIKKGDKGWHRSENSAN